MSQSTETLIGLLGGGAWKRSGINGGDMAVGIKLDPVSKGEKLAAQAIGASAVESQLSGQKGECDQGMGLKQVEQGELAQVKHLTSGGEGGLTRFVDDDRGHVCIERVQLALGFRL